MKNSSKPITADASATNNGASPKPKRQRPSKALPTERVLFSKQLDILRAYAVASGQDRVAVSNDDVARIVELAPTTVAMLNSFLVENGFLTKGDSGFVPSTQMHDFARAWEWNKETAAHKLRPLIAKSWFASVILQRLSFRTLTEDEALTDLADESGASAEYKPQLSVLLSYLEGVGLVSRDDGAIHRCDLAGENSTPPEKTELLEKPNEKAAPVSEPKVETVGLRKGQGGIQFDVSINVAMDEMAGWEADRITAFFGGLAEALKAKKGID